MRRITPVILSGGTGTRLWPLSREEYPKQLLPLLGDESLLQDTVRRVTGPRYTPPVLVCGEAHRFLIAEQLRTLEASPRAILLEPVARNTAPAVTAAAHLVAQDDPDGLLLVCPSDHSIAHVDVFEEAVAQAAAVAAEGRLVTFGIPARTPETGFGYIRGDGSIQNHPYAAHVAEFVEKPTEDLAREMVAQGEWRWNSGMFLFPAGLFLDELRRYAPDIDHAVAAAFAAARADLDFVRLDEEEFARCPSLSVDKAVMEHTDRAAVVDAALGWDDVGSWSALWRLETPDEAGNVLLGDTVDAGSSGCYVRSDGVLVATIGLEDTVVVATADVVLVADRARTQEVKNVVERLRGVGRPEATAHRVVHRPWGSYEVIDSGPGYQVKHLSVRPGHQLSLQTHEHRAEHWVVVSGTADVVRGEDRLRIQGHMSVDIPIGCVHRLGNPGPEPLHLVEVQTGDYLGEDDIVRLTDAYGRIPSMTSA
jgi:mannose-1-phosphate guanylyltransferase/mannose-6-phosphate isomerase